MFDDAVLETETGRVGGLLSASGARLEVVFEIDKPPVIVNRGKNYQTLKIPSLTLLQRVAPSHFQRLWEEEPEYLLHLALEQLPPDKRTGREAGKLLRQTTAAQDADAKKLAPLFRSLEANQAIAVIGGKTDKFYDVIKKPKVNLPIELQWLAGDGKSSPSKRPKRSKPNQEGSGSEVGLVGEKTESESAKEKLAVTEADKPEAKLMDFLRAAADESAITPEGFENWASRPFDQSVDVIKMRLAHGAIQLKKPRVFAYPLISLLPDEIWSSSKTTSSLLARIRNASLLDTIAQNWDANWQEFPHLNDLISSKLDVGKSVPPLVALKVIAMLGKLEIQDSALAIKLFEKGLKGAALKRNFSKEIADQDGQAVNRIFELAANSFSKAELRNQFLVWLVSRTQLPFSAEMLAGYSLVGLNALLTEIASAMEDEAAALKPQRLAEVFREVSAFSSDLFEQVGGEESLLAAISLQSRYPLEFDHDRLARFVISSLNKSERLQGLGRAISGANAAKEIERQRDELEVKLAEVTTKSMHLEEDLRSIQLELVENRKRSLGQRQEEQLSSHSAQKDLELPLLKMLARALSAAHEFLSKNEGAIGRFEILSDQAGLEKIGIPGQEVAFDPKFHNDPEEESQVGQLVVIQNVGFKTDNKDESIVLLKATVIKD